MGFEKIAFDTHNKIYLNGEFSLVVPNALCAPNSIQLYYMFRV